MMNKLRDQTLEKNMEVWKTKHQPFQLPFYMKKNFWIVLCLVLFLIIGGLLIIEYLNQDIRRNTNIELPIENGSATETRKEAVPTLPESPEVSNEPPSQNVISTQDNQTQDEETEKQSTDNLVQAFAPPPAYENNNTRGQGDNFQKASEYLREGRLGSAFQLLNLVKESEELLDNFNII